MHWRYMLYVVGNLIICFGMTMLIPLCTGLIYREGSTRPIFISMIATIACGFGLFLLFRRARQSRLTQREGMAIVAVGWAAIGLFGALPFYLDGPQWSFVDALFESVSGFTTTGASVLTDIESLSKGLLMWRSFIQWLGGMGIIVLSIAILPFLGVGGMQLYKAEVPSPVPDKLKPRIRDTARILWKVYVIFTAAEVLFLLIGGMTLFDAICHAFTTLPTGGFSTQNGSIAQFDSLYYDWVITIFMILAGVNFSLHFQLIRGKPLVFWKDPECRFFLAAVLLFTAIISWDCWGSIYQELGQAIRFSAFQVASIITTTGFATFDYEKWPALSQLILLLCMFMGASAGSTGGGMKCLRIMLCIKFCYKELFCMVHPRAVISIKLGGQTVSEDVMRSVLGFLSLFMGLFAISTILLAAVGVDFVTAFGAVVACIGNVGPGFGAVGPVGNYAQIPYLGKWLLIWCMLLGRLEIYTMLILLMPTFWRK